MKGLFITFEGPEGAGKSTQIGRIRDWLSSLGREVIVTREPGGTELGAEIRQLLLHQGSMCPEAEYLLYSADRAEHMSSKIKPALEGGKIVLCDRWLDSSLAYQGYGRGLDLDWLERVGAGAIGNQWPDKTILFKLDPKIGLARFETRDRLEAEPLEFHQRVMGGYLELAEKSPLRFSVVDAAQEVEIVFEAVKALLKDLLNL